MSHAPAPPKNETMLTLLEFWCDKCDKMRWHQQGENSESKCVDCGRTFVQRVTCRYCERPFPIGLGTLKSTSAHQSTASGEGENDDDFDDDDESFVPDASEEENDEDQFDEDDASVSANKRPKLDVESFAFVQPSNYVSTIIAGESTTHKDVSNQQPIADESSLFVGAIPSPFPVQTNASKVQAPPNDDSVEKMMKEQLELFVQIAKDKTACDAVKQKVLSVDARVENIQTDVDGLQKALENLQKEIENRHQMLATLQTERRDLVHQEQETQTSIKTKTTKLKENAKQLNEHFSSI